MKQEWSENCRGITTSTTSGRTRTVVPYRQTFWKSAERTLEVQSAMPPPLVAAEFLSEFSASATPGSLLVTVATRVAFSAARRTFNVTMVYGVQGNGQSSHQHFWIEVLDDSHCMTVFTPSLQDLIASLDRPMVTRDIFISLLALLSCIVCQHFSQRANHRRGFSYARSRVYHSR